MGQICTIWCDTIKQIRVFVGFILQPEMKLLENRPRPKNKCRKRWIFSYSPYSLHYVTILQGPVRPFGWDLKDQWRARWMSAATVLDRWVSVSSWVAERPLWTDESAYRCVSPVGLHAAYRKVRAVYALMLLMFVSASIQIADDMCHFYRLFGSAPYCNQFLTNLFETFKNLSKLFRNLRNCQFNRESAPWVRFYSILRQ